MDWIIILAIIPIIAGIFYGGWKLGGKDREQKIKLGALADIDGHYSKMADNFKKVDDMVDNAKSLLGSVRNTNKNRSAAILKAIKAKYSKNLGKKPQGT